jgi:hypothetical protein
LGSTGCWHDSRNRQAPHGIRNDSPTDAALAPTAARIPPQPAPGTRFALSPTRTQPDAEALRACGATAPAIVHHERAPWLSRTRRVGAAAQRKLRCLSRTCPCRIVVVALLVSGPGVADAEVPGVTDCGGGTPKPDRTRSERLLTGWYRRTRLASARCAGRVGSIML